jgi:hypothetical protein
MADDRLWGDNKATKRRPRPKPGSLIIATYACMTVGSLFVAFVTIDIGFQLKERHLWSNGWLSKRLIPAFLWDLVGGFWVAAGLDFWRVRPVRAVIRLAVGVAIVAGLCLVMTLRR